MHALVNPKDVVASNPESSNHVNQEAQASTSLIQIAFQLEEIIKVIKAQSVQNTAQEKFNATYKPTLKNFVGCSCRKHLPFKKGVKELVRRRHKGEVGTKVLRLCLVRQTK